LRRSFGFAGALLSGVAFRKLAMVMRAIGNVRVEGGGLVLGALGFFAYSAFGGLIVTTVARQPVQIFRALCAFTIAVASTLILRNVPPGCIVSAECQPR
jgi:hypothetical protein